MRPLRKCYDDLAGPVASIQVTERYHKPIASIRSQHVEVVGVTEQHRHKRRACRRTKAPGERFALATCGGQSMRREGIGAARSVEKNRELSALPAHRGHEAIAGFVAEGAGVDVVPLGSPHPALLGE